MVRVSGVYFLISSPTGMSCTFCVTVNLLSGTEWSQFTTSPLGLL